MERSFEKLINDSYVAKVIKDYYIEVVREDNAIYLKENLYHCREDIEFIFNIVDKHMQEVENFEDFEEHFQNALDEISDRIFENVYVCNPFFNALSKLIYYKIITEDEFDRIRENYYIDIEDFISLAKMIKIELPFQYKEKEHFDLELLKKLLTEKEIKEREDLRNWLENVEVFGFLVTSYNRVQEYKEKNILSILGAFQLYISENDDGACDEYEYSFKLGTKLLKKGFKFNIIGKDEFDYISNILPVE